MRFKKRIIGWGGLVLLFWSLFLSCQNDTEKTEAVFQRFIERYERRTKELNQKLRKAYWEMAMATNETSLNQILEEQSRYSKQYCYEEVQKKVNHLNHLIDQVHTNQKDLQLLQKIKRSGLIKDTLLLQQLDHLYFIYLDSQIPDSLSMDILAKRSALFRRLHNYRFVIEEDSINPFFITEEQNNRWTWDRLQQYHKSFAEFADSLRQPLIEIIHLRNGLAQNLGFDNYWDYAMASQHLNSQDVEELIIKGEEESREEFFIEKDWYDSLAADFFNIEPALLTRDHYPGGLVYNSLYGSVLGLDTLDIDPIEVATSFYNDMGFAIQEILGKSDLSYRPDKDPYTFFCDLNNEGDVRICSNIRKDIRGVKALLHTLGHAFYEKNISPDIPYLLRDPHQVITEGIAAYFTNLTDDFQWLNHYVYKNSPHEEWTEEQARLLRFHNFWRLRGLMLLSRLELMLYTHAEKPLEYFDSVFIDLNQQYFGMDTQHGIDSRVWATTRNIIHGSGNVQNYILAEMFAAQISHQVGQPFGEEGLNKEMEAIGAHLVEHLFKYGATKPWEELVVRATGQKLDPVYYQRTILTLN